EIRGVDELPGGVGVEETIFFTQPVDLMGLSSHGKRPGGFKLNAHVITLECFTQLSHVLHTQFRQVSIFLGQMAFTIRFTVHKRVFAEPAVASGGRTTNALIFDEHYLTLRITLLRLKSCPQTGIPATDNQQISFDAAV